MSTKIFLGGTVGGNKWRNDFTEKLINAGVLANDIFNPVVSDWNEAAREAEEKAKAESKYMMFYLADPKQEGLSLSAYSMVEATMALYDSPATTVVVFDTTGITGHSLKAMNQTEKVLRKRFPTANIFSDISTAVKFFYIDALSL